MWERLKYVKAAQAPSVASYASFSPFDLGALSFFGLGTERKASPPAIRAALKYMRLSAKYMRLSARVSYRGREKHLFTPHKPERSLPGDRTCRYPGRSDTIAHGQIHHAPPWQAGGETNLANAVLLRWHHRSLAHREAISIRHHDGGFIFAQANGTIVGIGRGERTS